MGTLGDMKARIADDLLRSDLTAQIANAIADAVKHYQRERFLFNEATATFNTVANQEYYTASDWADMLTAQQIDRLRILQGTSRLPMDQWPAAYMDAVAVATGTRGIPWQWSYEQQQLRLYPCPDAVYTITVFYLQKLGVPSQDSDTNAWTDDAEIMIRQRAKLILVRDVMGVRTPEMSEDIGLWALAEQADYTRLKGLTDQRRNTGFLRAMAF